MTEEQLQNELLYYMLLALTNELRRLQLISGKEESAVRRCLISDLSPTMGSIDSYR